MEVAMKCEEFDAIGWVQSANASLSELERAAARDTHSACSRCAALQDSCKRYASSCTPLRIQTAAAETPARVEMRGLRQEFERSTAR